MVQVTSLLVITGLGMPPYAMRGLTQTLAPIPAASSVHRTIGGVLKDTSAPQLRKYTSNIVGKDMQPPAFDAMWPGAQITVDCIAELCLPYETDEIYGRGYVENSIRYEDGFTYYRPKLVMLITNFNFSLDEYEAVVSWTLTSDEV